MIADPLFYVAATPAVILLGLSKGGFSGVGMLALPLMALFISPVQAAAITLPILIVQDVVSVWAFRRTWDRRNLVILLGGSLVGIVLGYLLAAQVSDAAVKLTVGVVSVAFALRRLVLERGPDGGAARAGGRAARRVLGRGARLHQHDRPRGRTPVPDLRPAAAPGARRVRRNRRDPVRARQLDQGPALPRPRPVHDREPRDVLALFPVAIASTWAGVWLVRRVPAERFYTIIYILLIAVGLKLLYDGALALI
jgi:uncharacterized membrane protein YfcA